MYFQRLILTFVILSCSHTMRPPRPAPLRSGTAGYRDWQPSGNSGRRQQPQGTLPAQLPSDRRLQPSATFPARPPVNDNRRFQQSASFPVGSRAYTALTSSSRIESTADSARASPTFLDVNRDAHLAFLIQNKDADPCKVLLDPSRREDPNSRGFQEATRACAGAYTAYYDLVQEKRLGGPCRELTDPECRLIKRRSTNRKEWTCTVKVRNPVFLAVIICKPFRVEHLEWCVLNLRPAITLKSLRYDRTTSLGRTVSSSEGDSIPKPIYTP
ncbi:unnamed protein product [Bemisia tabaci]|uniref:Secreted protein n=1 Tax=Bemisia tabaci TaxID=7038 RepID=A0A9P0A8U9_BEMTA|nr:unnamed protein product [Bemisia tabaci]